MHHGKLGTNVNGGYVTGTGGGNLPSQSRLKKNSAIDRSSSQATGMTSGKLGQSKQSQKMHNNESSLHGGSSKHLS